MDKQALNNGNSGKDKQAELLADLGLTSLPAHANNPNPVSGQFTYVSPNVPTFVHIAKSILPNAFSIVGFHNFMAQMLTAHLSLVNNPELADSTDLQEKLYQLVAHQRNFFWQIWCRDFGIWFPQASNTAVFCEHRFTEVNVEYRSRLIYCLQCGIVHKGFGAESIVRCCINCPHELHAFPRTWAKYPRKSWRKFLDQLANAANTVLQVHTFEFSDLVCRTICLNKLLQTANKIGVAYTNGQ